MTPTRHSSGSATPTSRSWTNTSSRRLIRKRGRSAWSGFASEPSWMLLGGGRVPWPGCRCRAVEGRLVHGEGYAYRVGKTPKLPALELAAEDYRRLARLAKLGDVTLEIDSRVHFEDADHNAYNILADIPGVDPQAGYVMAGAHLDSWVAGDGAADNGAGSAVVMEAAASWPASACSRGAPFDSLCGPARSRVCLARRLCRETSRASPAANRSGARGHSAVFFPGNLSRYRLCRDSRTWRLTSISTTAPARSAASIPKAISAWCRFFANGCPRLPAWAQPPWSRNPPDATDHVFLSRLGLPAFQFIQDPLDYETRVHHTDLDTFDHLRPEDLRQAAVVLASVLLDAANIDRPLPRKVLPTQPAGHGSLPLSGPGEEIAARRSSRAVRDCLKPASRARAGNRR